MSKQEQVEQAFQTLRNGVLEMIQDPSKLEQTLRHYGEYHQYNTYSGQNTLLLMFETAIRKNRPFQMARGYKQWQKQFNRRVNKGEKAMYILAPRFRVVVHVNEETGEEEKVKVLNGFTTASVFELSQTSGDPIPQPTKDHEYKTLNELHIQEFIDRCGVQVDFEDLVLTNGYTDGKRIVIGTHNSEIAQICTLFHELAHYHLHYDKGDEVELYNSDESVNFKELEAEAVAFMVSSALGIENEYSKKYISNWNKGVEDLNGEFEVRSLKLLTEALSQIDLFIDLVKEPITQ